MDYTPSNIPAPSHWTAQLSIKIARYKNLLRKFWWIPVLTTGIALAFQGWRVYKSQDLYTSSGKMIVSPQLNLKDEVTYNEDLSNFYGTQIEILEGLEVETRAYQRLSLEKPGTGAEVRILANQVPHTSIISVQGSGSDPEFTKNYVDAVMAEFIRFKRDQRDDTTELTVAQMSGETERLRKELEANEKDLSIFVEKNNMAFWDEQKNTAASFSSKLKIQEANLKKELRLLENLSTDQLLNRQGSSGDGLANMKTGNREGSDTESGSSVNAGSDLQTQYLAKRQELVQAQAELEDLSQVLKEAHPKLIRKKEEIASIERTLGVIRDQSKESTRSRIAEIRAELVSVDESIESWDQKSLEASRKGEEYDRFKSRADRARQAYEQMLANMSSLETGKNIGQETMQVLQPATPAEEVPPKVLVKLIIGLILGLGAGGGLLVLMDRADDRLTSLTEVNEQFSLPVLGQIPNVMPNDNNNLKRLPLLQPGDERYMFAEAFRNLRSSLVFMPTEQELRTLLITSAIPGEGKSTVSANLAITMAFAGARILLVDADLKRGDMAKLFSVDGRFGFSSVLRGDVSWQTVVQSTAYENLMLLPRGPVMNQPAELLLQPLMDSFIREVKATYDLVIFNSAPVLATDDTTTLAPNMDACLMVVRSFVTSARLADNSLNALYQRQAKILGFILNSVNTKTYDYYHYRYSQYYTGS